MNKLPFYIFSFITALAIGFFLGSRWMAQKWNNKEMKDFLLSSKFLKMRQSFIHGVTCTEDSNYLRSWLSRGAFCTFKVDREEPLINSLVVSGLKLAGSHKARNSSSSLEGRIKICEDLLLSTQKSLSRVRFPVFIAQDKRNPPWGCTLQFIMIAANKGKACASIQCDSAPL